MKQHGESIVGALEALAAGNVRLAESILLGALEEAEDRIVVGRGRHRCADCGAVFDWPGELDHHRSWSHWKPPDEPHEWGKAA
jgi:hypothetical protein